MDHLSRRCDQDLSMEDKTPCSPLLSYSNQLPPMSSARKTQHRLEKRSIRKVILDAPGLSQFAATNLYRRKYHLPQTRALFKEIPAFCSGVSTSVPAMSQLEPSHRNVRSNHCLVDSYPSLPLRDLSRKIEGPLIAGQLIATKELNNIAR